MKIFEKLVYLLKNIRHAHKVCAIPYLSLIRQIVALAKKPNLLGPQEYFELNLFDPKYSDRDRQQFVGYKAETLYRKLNHAAWHGMANDKLVFHCVMNANGLNTPQILGLIGKRACYFGVPVLNTNEDFHHFLSRCDDLPIFVKPIHGYYGQGTYCIANYQTKERLVELKDKRTICLEEMFASLAPYLDTGVLIQKTLMPSDEVKKLCGNRLSSVRIIVLFKDGKPWIHRANYKIPANDNVVCNTAGWTNGNMVAAVDETTGKIGNVFQGIKNQGISQVTVHPNTHTSFEDMSVPGWQGMVDYVKKAAVLFPNLQLQGWDLVDTDQGICGLEVNLVGNATVWATQFVSGRGFLNDALRDCLKSQTG